MTQNTQAKTPGIFRSEMALWIGIITTIVFFVVGQNWLMDLSNPLKYGFFFIWLIVVMLWLSFGVVRHADCLAVMLTGENNPTLARDTMFSVLMIVLNGMLGLTLLMGGLRHHEQEYSLSGASAYLGVLYPLAVLGLVVPRFTTSAPGGQVSILMTLYLVIMSAGLYAVFLLIQTMRHSHFFKRPTYSKEDDLPNVPMS
jgi:Ca2+:H+ antiporter